MLSKVELDLREQNERLLAENERLRVDLSAYEKRLDEALSAVNALQKFVEGKPLVGDEREWYIPDGACGAETAVALRADLAREQAWRAEADKAVLRLKAALEAAKRKHYDQNRHAGEKCPLSYGGAVYEWETCDCGADAHNAAIDAALQGKP